MNEKLEKLTMEQGLDVKVGGFNRISVAIEKELYELRELGSALKSHNGNLFYDFGNNGIVLYTNDFGDIGAITIYLAKQLGCRVICCKKETLAPAPFNNKFDINSVSKEAEYLVKIYPAKGTSAMFCIDDKNYGLNNGIMNRFRLIMSRPFGSEAIKVVDSEGPSGDIEKKFDCEHISLGLRDESIIFDRGPVLKTYTIAYSIYMWLRDDINYLRKNYVIVSRIGEAAMLEALAYEASELSQAASLKARKLRGDNPTPESIYELSDNLDEEYTDVYNCAIELGLTPNKDIIREKDNLFLELWNKRNGK